MLILDFYENFRLRVQSFVVSPTVDEFKDCPNFFRNFSRISSIPLFSPKGHN